MRRVGLYRRLVAKSDFLCTVFRMHVEHYLLRCLKTTNWHYFRYRERTSAEKSPTRLVGLAVLLNCKQLFILSCCCSVYTAHMRNKIDNAKTQFSQGHWLGESQTVLRQTAGKTRYSGQGSRAPLIGVD